MFPIYYGNRELGKATLDKQGLYYRILCKCNIPTDALCTIHLQTNEKDINLGTCIRVGNQYIIDTKIPIKHVQNNDLKFCILPKNAESSSEFIPIEENSPFPNLQRLDKGRMRRQDGRAGIVFIE